MIVKTLNTTYEIDEDSKKFRRLTDTDKEDHPIGKEWQSFDIAFPPEVGMRLVVYMGDECLRTSEILSIEEEQDAMGWVVQAFDSWN